MHFSKLMRIRTRKWRSSRTPPWGRRVRRRPTGQGPDFSPCPRSLQAARSGPVLATAPQACFARCGSPQPRHVCGPLLFCLFRSVRRKPRRPGTSALEPGHGTQRVCRAGPGASAVSGASCWGLSTCQTEALPTSASTRQESHCDPISQARQQRPDGLDP